MNQLEKLTLFYDAACPLCRAEIVFLSRRNQAGLLDFVDIHSSRFDANKLGVSCEQAMAAMYGQYESGALLRGVAVFPEAYRRANLPLLAWIFSRQSLQPVLKISYQFFAKYRQQISRILGPVALCAVELTTKNR
jgi:predicted DCC family thiol-disulfide oxidoreductase YuxK